jgi:hypothetical protein
MTYASSTAADLAPSERAALVRRGLRLNYLTITYNALEAVVSIAAGLAAGSVALLGFGIDSVIEVTSSAAAQWRLRTDRDCARREEVERQAHRVIGGSFLALAAYVAYESATALWYREQPERSLLGVAIRALKAVSVRSCVLGLAAAGTVGACRGEAERAGEPIAHRRLRVDTASPPPALTGAMLLLGDSVFHGQVGNAQCSRCHQQRAAGAPVGPELTHSQWLRVAPYGSVVHFLAHGQRDARGEDLGVPHPGAAQLSAAELRAVALYVDSLARRGQGPSR